MRALALLLSAMLLAVPLGTAAQQGPTPPTRIFRHGDNLFIGFRPGELIVTLLVSPALPRHFAEANDSSRDAFTRLGAHLSAFMSRHEGERGCSDYWLSIDTLMLRAYELEIGVVVQPLTDGRRVTLFTAHMGGDCLAATAQGAYASRLYRFDFKEHWLMTLSGDLRTVVFEYAGWEK